MQKKNFIFGKKPVYETIKKNPNLIQIVHLLNYDKILIDLLNKNHVKYLIHNNQGFFKQFDKNVNHQNYVAELKPNHSILKIIDFDYLTKKVYDLKKHAIVLVLDSITDMQNFGAILRTAYAADVLAVVFKKDRQAQINDYIIKTSMGFIQNIALLPVVNLNAAINKLKEIGFWIFASSLDPNRTVSYETLKYDCNVALIIGNEQNGVSRLVAQNADYLIKIPMHNAVDSLNVSVACGVLLFGINLIQTLNENKPNHQLNQTMKTKKG